MTLLLKGINQSINILVNSGLLSRVNSNWHSMGCEEVATVAGEEAWGRYQEVLPGSGIAISRLLSHPNWAEIIDEKIHRSMDPADEYSLRGGERTGSQFLKEWNDRSIERDCLLYYYDLWIHLPNPSHKQKKNTVIQSKTKTKKQLKQWYKVEEEDVERRSR